ncbi:MAG TPA: hypothetical protein VFZ42_05355 [Chitinophagaceae bacterium]
MKVNQFAKAGLLTVAVVVTFIFCWETYWRTKGFVATFNDDKVLWANARKAVYQPIDKATVFIGSSRIKFDLDIAEWEKLTGEKAVQLALVGTSPRQLLQDLANDEKFKGKLVVDVTEPLFFSQIPVFHKSANEAVDFYKKQTPSEKFSSSINFALESRFVFLEEGRFSLNTLLNDLEVPSRPGVFVVPPFPKGFEWTKFNRQTFMSAGFLADTQLINRQTNIWKKLIMGNPAPPVSGKPLQAILDEVAAAVKKIQSRGGKVIFVRTPSSGPMAEGEQKTFPRAKYWDALLAASNARGIHYADNEKTASFICPEWSHLSPNDAILYTQYLIEEMRQLGWFS